MTRKAAKKNPQAVAEEVLVLEPKRKMSRRQLDKRLEESTPEEQVEIRAEQDDDL